MAIVHERYCLSADFVADEQDTTVAAVMNLNTGEIFEMQGTGTAIVYALIHGQTRAEIVSELGMAYEVDEQLAINDVNVMLDQLLDIGAIVIVSAE